MEKNESLKKFYEMSVMMVNTGKSVYYDNVGLETGQLVPNYDTDSEDEEGEGDDNEENPRPHRLYD